MWSWNLASRAACMTGQILVIKLSDAWACDWPIRTLLCWLWSRSLCKILFLDNGLLSTEWKYLRDERCICVIRSVDLEWGWVFQGWHVLILQKLGAYRADTLTYYDCRPTLQFPWAGMPATASLLASPTPNMQCSILQNRASCTCTWDEVYSFGTRDLRLLSPSRQVHALEITWCAYLQCWSGVPCYFDKTAKTRTSFP